MAWLVPDDARTVVDLGAGTGKLTRALRAPGREVIAVEPSAGMREQFAQVLPDVRILDGSGESIPLPDKSVDTLVCAQAWHWVDPERAVPEVARVLRRQLDGLGVSVERRDFRWSHPITADEAMDMIASRSYVITLPPEPRAELLGRVRELLDTQRPAAMPYVTECYRVEIPLVL